MVDHLGPKWLNKFTMVVYPLYHVGRVGGGMVVTTMTYYDGSNHFEGITDLVKRRKSIEKLTNNLLSKLVLD